MYFNLKMVKEAIELNTENHCTIKEVYDNLRDGVKHVTIIDDAEQYQMLSPLETELANNGLLELRNVQSLINVVNKRGW